MKATRLHVLDATHAALGLMKLFPDFQAEDHGVIGSVEINGEGEDVDIMILVNGNDAICIDDLYEHDGIDGWKFGGYTQIGGDHRWVSFKKEIDGLKINVLLTESKEYFKMAMLSVSICQLLRFFAEGAAVPKPIRVGVHRVLMDEQNPGLVYSAMQELYPEFFK